MTGNIRDTVLLQYPFFLGQSRMFKNLLITLTLFVFLPGAVQARGVYQHPDEFVSQAFAQHPPEPHIVWLKDELQQDVKHILGHAYRNRRIRYWLKDHRSVWVLEEIGKKQPITTGIIVNHGKIESIKVLVFRETRGWEVKYPFFTDQFKNVSLVRDQRLDKTIDGISGATLSVRAVKKLARMALYLDHKVDHP